MVSGNNYVTGESHDFVFLTLNTVPAKSEFINWYLIQVCVLEKQAPHTFTVLVKLVTTPDTTWYLCPQNNTCRLAEKFRVNLESAIT